MSEPSNEAWDKAREISCRYCAEEITWLAVALQEFMDANRANADAFDKLSDGYLQRAVVAETELTHARATIARLNRRCQVAEGVADQNLATVQRAGVSIGRSLANYGYYRMIAELRELADAHDTGEPSAVIAGLRELIARWSKP